MIQRFIIILLLISNLCKGGNWPVSEYPVKKTKTESTKTNFQLGTGLMGSVLYLSRNVKEDNDALGYTFMANYTGEKICRFNLQYTYYKPINIEPTWYTIKAHTIEANLEILARFKNNKTFLYPFLGVSLNTFKGYFTGMDDFLNLREHYKPQSTIVNNWLGLNVGSGLEHNIGPVVLFIDYRMRIGRMEKYNGYNIMDVCYGGGIRIKLSIPPKNGVRNFFHNFNNRYHWF